MEHMQGLSTGEAVDGDARDKNQPSREPAGCGCDHIPQKLIPVEEALARGLALAEAVTDIETRPLASAIGRVLASEAVSQTALPPFDNSAMDGYVLRLADLGDDGPYSLPVAGRVAAGDSGLVTAPPGAALRIFTGAPIPTGFDTVVMQEMVTREGDQITLAKRPRLGDHVRKAGEDLAVGETILPAGLAITAREAGALAAIGAGEVSVRRKVKVAMFCTGSELKQPGEALGPGQIWNSNRYTLLAHLAKPWIEIMDLGAIPDEPAALMAALREAADKADMVISTGGVSVGDEDHMPRLFAEAGGTMHAMKVAMKPGKPLAIGKLGTAIYVGLPGNPVSAFVTWQIIGARILERLAGLAEKSRNETVLPLQTGVKRHAGRCEFRPAKRITDPASGETMLALLAPSFSARIALLAEADGLAVLPAACEDMAAGTHVTFLPY